MKFSSSLLTPWSYTLRSQRFALSLASTALLASALGTVMSQPGVAQTNATANVTHQAQSANQLPSNMAQRVIQDAAQRSQVSTNQIRIFQATARTFTNSCVFEFGDRCYGLNEPLNGWEVIVSVKGQPWRYHVENSSLQLALDPRTVTDIPVSTIPDAPIDAVILDATRRAKVSPAAIRILQMRPVSFSNPCMLHFGEYCQGRPADPIQGYEVLAQVNNQTWKYNVDRPGTRVVLDPKVTAGVMNLPVALQNRILADASTRSGLPTTNLQITQASQKSFSNACVFTFGEMCPTVYQPIEGWEAVVKVRDQSWTYRIDRTGAQLALDPRVTNVATLPLPVANAVLQNAKTWTNAPTAQILAAKPQTWGNDCAFNFGRLCPANYQPLEGWTVQVKSGDLEWSYNTNKSGSQVVMDRRVILPTKVADGITRDILKRSGPSVQPNSLRFLEVKEQTKRVCFLFKCRNEITYLVIVANGRQQWGYESDDQGRRVIPMSVAQVRQAKDEVISQR